MTANPVKVPEEVEAGTIASAPGTQRTLHSLFSPRVINVYLSRKQTKTTGPRAPPPRGPQTTFTPPNPPVNLGIKQDNNNLVIIEPAGMFGCFDF